jgi:hypothetical protein
MGLGYSGSGLKRVYRFKTQEFSCLVGLPARSDGSTHQTRVWRVNPLYLVNKWIWRVDPSDPFFFSFLPALLRIAHLATSTFAADKHAYSLPITAHLATSTFALRTFLFCFFFFFLLHTHHFSLFSQFFCSFFFPLLFHSTPRLPPSFFFLFLFPFFTIFSTQHHSLEFKLHTRHFHDTQLLHCYSPLKRRLTLVTPCP